MAACLHVSAALYSQKVTLNERNSKLSEVFVRLREQTGYNFVYNNKLLKKAAPVTVRTANEQLEEALREIFKDQPLTFSIIEKTIVVKEKERTLLESVGAAMKESVQALLPDGPVRGTVTDENGDPLPGVTVILQVPNAVAKTSVTNANGKYDFAGVPSGSVLVFNMIGFKRHEVPVGNKGVIHVRLSPDVKELQNVVITGYQEIKKESFTGTAVTVKGEDLKRVNPQNLLKSIQSFDPSFKILDNNIIGSNPNALPSINVRGSSSLPGGSTDILRRDNLTSTANLPAFILDGYEVSLEKVYDLDINRIESVTLLKDAAATAVYGSRAANGVLVITTKAPKEGKLQLSYNYETNVTGPDLSDYHVLNGADKLEYERLAGLYSNTVRQNYSQDQLNKMYYDKKEKVLTGFDTYWLSQPLETAIGQKHSLYVEGGNPLFRYGIDLRYQTMPGVMKESGRDRYSGGMSFSYNSSSKLQFKNDVSVSYVKSQDSPYGSFSTYARMNPYYPVYDDKGNVIRQIDTWINRETSSTGSDSITTDPVLNPLYDAQLSSFSKSSYIELIDAFAGDWTIAKGLRLRGVASLTSRNHTGDNFKSPLANEFFNYSTDRIKEKGRYINSQNRETIVDGNIRLTWVKQISDHFFNMMLGGNIRTELSDYKEVTAIGFPNDRFASIGFAGGYGENATPYSSLQRSRLLGSFFSLNYSFKNRYLLDATVRADGSSKFGLENKIAPFWSLGLGWNIHKEDFFHSDLISQLRIRTSTGLTGSVSFDPYLSKTTYSYYTNNWYSSGVGAAVKAFGNENLAWQKTWNYDLSVDLGLLNDRLYFSPRVYFKRTKGLVADVMLPPSTGFPSYKENVGDMENKGVELMTNLNVLKTKDWSLSFNANLTRLENKIVRISNALKRYNERADEAQDLPQDKGGYRGVPLLRFNEGQSINAIYAVPSLGIDPENGKEIFIKKDGTLTYEWDVRDIGVVGDATNKLEGFFGTTINYKNFMLTATFQTYLGGDQYNQTLVDRVENADPAYNVDSRAFVNRWKQPGDKVQFKDISELGSTRTSSRFVQKNNMLSLQSLYLSYQAGKSLASRLGMSSLRFSATGNDIWYTSSVKQERGLDYPFARTVTFSVQAVF